MNFREFGRDLEIPEGTPTIEADLPLVVSEPVRISDIQISLSESLRDVVATAVSVDGACAVRVACSALAVSDGPISGEINALDQVTGRRSTMRLTLRRATRFVVSPSLMVFSRDASKADEQFKLGAVWRATAILRIRSKPSMPEEAGARGQVQNFEPVDLSLSCRIGKQDIKAVASPIGKASGYYRVVMETPDDPASAMSSEEKGNKEAMLEMSFRADGEMQLLEFPFISVQ